MPFTERDLRSMLEDNSSDVPATSDLAATAEAHGRKVRRRRIAAGSVAAAAVLALGFTVVLSSEGDKTERPAQLAATVSPTIGPPVDVDYSVFTDDLSRDRAMVYHRLRPSSGTISTNTLAVTGTVAGFSLQKPPGLPGPDELVMNIKVTRAVRATGITQSGAKEVDVRPSPDLTWPSAVPTPRLPPPDEPVPVPSPDSTVSVRIWTAHRSDAGRYAKAVPNGARVLAMVTTTADKDVHQAIQLIFEDVDRSLVGGVYEMKQVPAPWNKAKTFDELAALAPELPGDCGGCLLGRTMLRVVPSPKP